MPTPGSVRATSSGSGTRRTAGRWRSDGRSWTDRRWPARRKARRSRRSTTWATRSGGSARRSFDVPRLRAVLFDVDGTLLDTRDAWVAAFDAGLAAIRKASISGSEAAQWIGTPVEALRVTGLLPFCALVLGGDSVPRKKPAPDPVLRAASGLGVEPPECAVVGYTENDVRAGKAAGARTIGVTWGYGTRSRLEAAGVDYLIETPEALPPLLRALTPSTAA